MRKPRLVAAVVATAAAATAAAFSWSFDDPPARETPFDASARDTGPILVDADTAGALVIGDRGLVGYRRRASVGSQSWSVPLDEVNARSVIACARDCSRAVVSGRGPEAPNLPGPLIAGGGRLPDGVPAGAEVIASVGEATLVRTSDGTFSSVAEQYEHVLSRARGQLSVFPWSPDRTVLRVQVNGDQGSVVTLLFALRDGRFMLTGKSASADAAACGARAGSRWIVDGRRASVLPSGMVRAGFPWCALGRTSVVYAQNLLRADGETTHILQIWESGESRSLEFRRESLVLSVANSDTIIAHTFNGGELEIIPPRGERTTIRNVAGALPVEDGSVCVVRRDGTVEWVQPS